MVLGGTGVLTSGVAGASFNGGLSNAATVFVSADTTFNSAITNTASFTYQGTVNNSFANSGTVTLNNNATITGLLANSGRINVTNGTLRLLTAPTQNGTISITLNNTLSITPAWNNAGSLLFSGGYLVGGTTTNTASGQISGFGTLSNLLVNLGTVVASNGTLHLVNAPLQNGVVSVASAGTLDVAQAWRNGGALNLSGGTVIGGTLTNAGSISGFGTFSPSVINNSGATITASGGGTLTLTAFPLQNGIVNILGTLNVASAWTNSISGTVQVSGGTLTGGSLANLGTVKGFGAVNPNITNTGTILAGVAGQTLRLNGSTFVNLASGVVTANTGNIVVSGAFTNAGTLTMIHSIGTFAGAVVNSGAWVTDPTTNVFQDTYTVTSSGFIQSSAGDVYIFTNSATTAGSFINVSTNKAQYNTLAGDFVFANTLGVTQVFAAAGHDLGPVTTTATNQLQVFVPDPFSLPEYSNNFALGTLETSSFTTVRVDDAFITGGPGTNDNLEAALYLNNLFMGTGSLLLISSNVQVYFITSNNWSLANIQLAGNPNYDQLFNGIHQLVVVPEPAIVLLWVSSIVTVYAARRRNARSAKS